MKASFIIFALLLLSVLAVLVLSKENGGVLPHHHGVPSHCKRSKCPKRTGCAYDIDRKGCKVCVCKRCLPKPCIKWCKHGYIRDKFGCKTCKCFKKH